MKIDNFTPSEKIFEKRIAIEDEKRMDLDKYLKVHYKLSMINKFILMK